MRFCARYLLGERVVAARGRQLERFTRTAIFTNARMKLRHAKKWCRPEEDGQLLLRQAMDALGLSARAYDKILKTARTIADLEDADGLLPHHITEAVTHRILDRRSVALFPCCATRAHMALTVQEELLAELVGRIAEAVHPQKIILLGSFAREDASQDSDLGATGFEPLAVRTFGCPCIRHARADYTNPLAEGTRVSRNP